MKMFLTVATIASAICASMSSYAQAGSSKTLAAQHLDCLSEDGHERLRVDEKNAYLIELQECKVGAQCDAPAISAKLSHMQLDPQGKSWSSYVVLHGSSATQQIFYVPTRLMTDYGSDKLKDWALLGSPESGVRYECEQAL